jgi:hypothetical protein
MESNITRIAGGLRKSPRREQILDPSTLRETLNYYPCILFTDDIPFAIQYFRYH